YSRPFFVSWCLCVLVLLDVCHNICKHLKLINLLDLDTLVILLQNLFIGSAVHGHAISAYLAHAHPVSPAAAVKHDAENLNLSGSLNIKREQAVAQAKQCPEPECAHRCFSCRSCNLGAQRALRRPPAKDAQVLNPADVERLERGV